MNASTMYIAIKY